MKEIRKYISELGLLGALLLFYLVNPFGYGYVFGYIIVLVLLLKRHFISKNLDHDFIVLMIFSIIYALFYIFDPVLGKQYIVIYGLFPGFMYLLGKYLAQKTRSEWMVFIVLISLGFWFSATAMVSVFLNIMDGGLGQLDRNLPMIWSGNKLAATIIASFFTLNMCLPSILIGRRLKGSLFQNIVLVSIFVLSVLCVLRLGSRTQIVICLFTIFYTLIYIIPRQSARKNIYLFLAFFILVGLIIRNVSFDLSSDWLSAFAGRMEHGGGDTASGGGRTERWVKSFEYLFIRPLGWSVKEFGFAHNMWLDVARFAGIIPFLILIYYTIRSFFKVKKATSLHLSLNLNNQFRVYFLAFMLIFMVEPVFDGLFSIFTLFCIYMGFVTGQLNRNYAI